MARQFHRRSAGKLMLAGVGTITLDQRMRRRPVLSARAALQSDWEAIGGDFRRALDLAREFTPV